MAPRLSLILVANLFAICLHAQPANDNPCGAITIPVTESVVRFSQLSGNHYYWKDINTDQSLQIGLIAQEVQKLFPELVRENEKGELSVNYSGLLPVLIESVKELKQQADNKNRKQEQQIQELKDQLHQLIKRMDKRKSL